MFETQALFVSSEETIRLDTRLGNPIRNSKSTLSLPVNAQLRYEGFLKDYSQASWVSRAPIDHAYNCTGHVWASRRTCIFEVAEWGKILKEDGYSRTDQPVVDDVVIYYMDTEMTHVARVVEVITSEIASTVVVVSKWGDTGGEVRHFVHEVPSFIRGNYEFWTDRKGNAPALKRAFLV